MTRNTTYYSQYDSLVGTTPKTHLKALSNTIRTKVAWLDRLDDSEMNESERMQRDQSPMRDFCYDDDDYE